MKYFFSKYPNASVADTIANTISMRKLQSEETLENTVETCLWCDLLAVLLSYR